MERLTDEELVVRCLDGQRDAFAILVNRYQNQIYSLAYRLGGDYDEARDLAQEAFIRIYKELPRFDTSRRFFPWMYRVAHNTCINFLQKKPREIIPLDNFVDSSADEEHSEFNPGKAYEQKEKTAIIAEAIQSLPENYRLPLILKYLENMSYQEISEHLELPITTIETRLFRGRQMLKQLLITRLEKSG